MMLELGKDMIKKALGKGCDAAEVFIKSSSGISVEAKEGSVEALEASREFGISVKVISKGRLGFSFTTDSADADKIVDEALEGARWTAEDEFVGIPEALTPAETLVYDNGMASLSDEDMMRNALLLERSALSYDSRIRKVRKAEVSRSAGSTTIINSRGVAASYEGSYYTAHVTALAQDEGGDSQTGWEYAVSRRVSDVNVQAVGREAARKAVELLGSRKISAVRLPVILNPSVATDFLRILSSSLSSEAVQKKRSFLTGRTGEKIISRLVNIVDDGTLPWAPGTKPVDDEGVPTKAKTLVHDGVLRGYIYNTYTAKKDGVVSTGNALRGGFKTLPGVGVTNIFIKPGNSGTGDDLIRSLPRGVVILGAMGVHTANPVSGDFSIGISGLRIDSGAAVYPFKEAVMSGNILDMFRKVEGVGSDLTFYGNAGSPSLLFGEMDISA